MQNQLPILNFEQVNGGWDHVLWDLTPKEQYTSSLKIEIAMLMSVQQCVISKVVVRRCSAKKVFLEISQNSQENTCDRISFLIKLQAFHQYQQEYLKQLIKNDI